MNIEKLISLHKLRNIYINKKDKINEQITYLKSLTKIIDNGNEVRGYINDIELLRDDLNYIKLIIHHIETEINQYERELINDCKRGNIDEIKI